MADTRPEGGIELRSRLRTRMAISYVAVTLVIVLLLESLVVGFLLYAFTRSPIAGFWAMQGAGNAAQIYALEAAVQGGGAGLNPNTTFAPGQAESLSLRQEAYPQQENWFRWNVSYIQPGAPAPNRPAVALLIGPDERVIASSYPDRYPVSASIPELMPEETGLIRGALAGNSNGAVRETAQSRHASVAQTVWSRDHKPLGAVYVQAPAGAPPNMNLLPALASILIPSGILWLCLMLPIGMVFGVLSTRGLIRRIERLAEATARFKEGDTSTRVPVGRADEIGQLEGQFNAMAGQLVESFAQRQALAEQSARREERARIEQEMKSAHYIQQSLLPEETPTIPGWELQTLYRPAREVGGDLYDFLALPDGRIGIVIGDATGKGIPSALIMATTNAMLRAAAPGSPSPGKVLGLVNNLLQEHIPPGTFATCFYATLDPSCGRLCFANAGHNLPYVLRGSQVFELQEKGMPLGLMPDQEYAEEELTLAAEDTVLFYTDGLVEAHDGNREMFGSPRLRRRIKELSNVDCLIESLYNDLQDFTGPEWEQEDDVTLVLLRKTT